MKPAKLSPIAIIEASLLLISSLVHIAALSSHKDEAEYKQNDNRPPVPGLAWSIATENDSIAPQFNSLSPEGYLDDQQDDNQHALIYERVVEAGSNISISCPQLALRRSLTWPSDAKTRTTWSEETTLTNEEDRTASSVESNEQEATTLLGSNIPPRPTLDKTSSSQLNALGHSRVKWFRNHVPLVNLNHLHYGCCDNKTGLEDGALSSRKDAQITTIKSVPELNQTTELSETSKGDNIEQKSKTTSRLVETEGGDLDHLNEATHRLGLDFEITRKNVNELVASRKSLNSQLKEGSTRWYINKFGELIIDRITANFAGKYTCLGLGKQSDVLLHVVEVSKDGFDLLVRHQRTTIDNRVSNNVRLQDRASSNLFGIGQESDRDEVNEFRPVQSTTGRQLGVIGSDTPKLPDLSSSSESNYDHNIDHKSYKEKHANSFTRSSVTILDSAQDVGQLRNGGNQLANKPDDTIKSKKRVQSIQRGSARNSSAFDARVWNKAPIQSVRIENIQLNDLKFLPGLIYSKQRLHCPIWRSANYMRDFIATFIERLCSSREASALIMTETFPHLRECRDMVSDLLRDMDTLKTSDNHYTSILELAWFKDGEQLVFDSATGKAANEGPATNVRLINFCDQLDTTTPVSSCDGELKQKESESDRSRDGASSSRIDTLSDQDEPISRSRGRVSWMCPSIGRTLEIDGVRQDNAGHFSCAFKLNTVKLHRYILDVESELLQKKQKQKQREWIPASSHNISYSEIEGSVETFQLPERPGDASRNANETTTTTTTQPIQLSQAAARVEERQEQANTGRSYEPRSGNGWINLSKLIAKELDEQLKENQATNHTDNLTGLNTDPMAIVQTFSLVVLERSASDAYFRRKWLNLKRLKRDRIRAKSLDSSSSKHEVDENSRSSSELHPMIARDDETVISLSQQQSMNANSDHSPNSIGPAGAIDENKQSQWVSFDPLNHQLSAKDQLNSLQGQQDKQRFITIEPEANRQLLAIDRRRLNNANEESGVDITSVSKSTDSNGGPSDPTVAHETPFNYANERNLKLTIGSVGANKNGIMGINGGQQELERSERSATVKRSGYFGGSDDNQGVDISSSVRIKELITQIGRGTMSSRQSMETLRGASEPNITDQQQNESALGAIERNESVRARRATSFERHTMIADDGPQGVIESVGGLSAAFWSDQPRPGSISRLADHRQESEGLAKSHSRLRRLKRVALTSRQEVRLLDDLGGRSGGTSNHEHQSSHSDGSDGADGLDDDLMWIAGQYLYMEVKATAGSPLFGAEVSVEWSNERANDTSSFVTYPEEDSSIFAERVADSIEENDITNRLDSGRHIRDTSPFATIDVIPGQSLHLQCTAHALGRLPEVRWYKLISGRDNLRAQSNRHYDGLARKVGEQVYWPLEDLDPIRANEVSDTERVSQANFVHSQSTTLFNNLINQTFTVVNNLQLSLDSDTFDLKDNRFALDARDTPIAGQLQDVNQNLFACIVDADVRHNFVSIGVNFPTSDLSIKKIPIEISKRLQAKALYDKSAIMAEGRVKSREPRHLSDRSRMQQATTLNLMDDDSRAGGTFWVALGNGSKQLRKSQDFPTTATTLSILIVVALGSLLSLVFLTLKSYQRLTRMQIEYGLDDYVGKDDVEEFACELNAIPPEAERNLKNYASYMMIEDDGFNMVHGDARCMCQLNHNMVDHVACGDANRLTKLDKHSDICSVSDQSDTLMIMMMMAPTCEQTMKAENLSQRYWNDPSTTLNEGELDDAERINEKDILINMVDNPMVVAEECPPPSRYITSLTSCPSNKSGGIESV